MFDSVMVPCPTCGEPGEFQSKSGACMLKTYTLDEAPDDVLLDVNRHAPVHCPKCATRYGVEIIGERPRRTLTARPCVMYDTVTVPCPTCGEPGKFQSKSGECRFAAYTLDEAPDDVLLDISRSPPHHTTVRCHQCATCYGVKVTGSRLRGSLTARPYVWD